MFWMIFIYVCVLSQRNGLNVSKNRNNVIESHYKYKIPIIKNKDNKLNTTIDKLVLIQEQLFNLSPSQSFLQFSHKIQLRNIENSLYIGIIHIGDPAIPIKVLLDTGSIYTWISSSKCDETCINPSFYSRKDSSSFELIPIKTDITYGNGQYFCEFNLETIDFGGIILLNQFFGEIKHQEGDYLVNDDFEGLIGLAYPSMQINQKYTPLFDSIISLKVLQQNIMAFYLSINEEEKGEMTIGYIDNTKYEGNLKYYDVIDQYYWSIELTDIKVNGISLEFCKEKCKAIIDTGSSLISGPSKKVKELLMKIPHQTDCNDNTTGNTLSFVFGNNEYTLLPEEYLIQYHHKGSSQCQVLIEPLDLNTEHGPAWIIGEIFLQKYYVVFDRDNNQVGFAKAIHSS